jgi:hypothetical protein
MLQNWYIMHAFSDMCTFIAEQDNIGHIAMQHLTAAGTNS